MHRYLSIGLVAYLFVFGIVFTASAHEASVRAYEVLGIAQPTVLPDSPFYFLKNFTRGITRIFTFDPVKKAELELQIADERLAELDEMARKSDAETKDLSRALENYVEAHNRLQARLEALRGKNKNADALFERLADRVLDHTELFKNLEDELDADETAEVHKELLDDVKKARELDDKKFKEKIKERFSKDKLRFEDFELDTEIKDELEDIFSDVADIELDDRNGRDEDKKEPSGGVPDKEVVCTKELKPVCGNDGKTYSNSCRAKKEGGVGVQYEGTCKEPPPAILCTTEFNPVCGTDGKTYSNSCQAKASGIAIKSTGECKAPEKPSVSLPVPISAPKAPEPQTINISIENFAFDKREVSVPVGSKIIWTNKDGASHTATSDTGAFDSGLLSTGSSFKRTFTEKGTFPYHCSPHPGMQATIIVE